MLRRGGRLGKYVLEKKLGAGGFAEVWRARDTVERLPVALKVALPEAVEDLGRNVLEQEARLLVRLRHPHILETRNADWIDGRFVIAAELARTNLAGYSRARRSPRVALDIVRQIASALAHAHEQRLLHRDIKPENVLIFADDRAVLADFGVSRFAHSLDRTFSQAGTLGYLAPEQAYGRPRFASDVFSLGVMAYELLTGALLSWPFEWPTTGHERFEAKVPEPVRPVLRRAVQFRPEKRFVDGMEFHRAFTTALERAEAPRRTPRRPRKRLAPPPSPRVMEAAQFRRLHRSALGLRYACYACEGPMAEGMSHCPWCGAGDHSLREVTVYPLVCPECEHGVQPEWTACPWCYQGRFEGNGRPPRPDPAATRNCAAKGCPGQLKPFMRYCPVCKLKVARPWRHSDLPDRCPRCRWSVSREYWRFCPWCGRREPGAGAFGRAKSRKGAR